MAEREVEIEISALGVRGDGIAEGPRGPLYVPFAAPGDRLRVRIGARAGDGWRAEVVARLREGAGRAAPPCPQFGACGGCAVQQLSPDAYAAWKRGLVVEALAHRGLDAAVVGPLQRVPEATRRRARLQLRGTQGGGALGFHAAHSHRIVALDGCVVLHPDILRLRPRLAGIMSRLLGPGARAEAAVTVTEGGLDVTLALAGEPDLTTREALIAFAAAADLARLSWRPLGRDAGPAEPVIQRRSPRVSFGGVSVVPPPDAFLQPTGAGEAMLRDAVAPALAGARRIADLYAGCGAFALPLARDGAHALALDDAPDHIAALKAAGRAAGFGERVQGETRNLDRRPLAGPELAGLDAVILDPPRAGAASQARALAGSAVPLVAYVSCNPASFARDARTLVDGGYALDSVTPVDQFLYTPHLELAALFRATGRHGTVRGSAR